MNCSNTKDVNIECKIVKFYDFNLIIDNRTGYFNGVKLCFSFEKDFNEWKSKKRTKELIKYISNKVNFPEYGIFYEVSEEESYEFSGIYVCSELLLDLTSWLSHEFFFNMNNILIENGKELTVKKNEFEENFKNFEDIVDKKLTLFTSSVDKEIKSIQSQTNQILNCFLCVIMLKYLQIN